MREHFMASGRGGCNLNPGCSFYVAKLKGP